MKRKELQKLFLSNEITLDNYDKSVNILKLNASKQEWQKFIDIALLFLGGLFFIIGMLFFFAYNWDNLNKFVKLFIPFFILTLAILLTLKYNLDSLVSRVSLVVAFFAIGIEFALFGQIYQTGADAWNLFFAWSLFGFGFIFGSKSSIHWVLWSIIVNVTITLFITQTTSYEPTKFLIGFAIINILFFYFMLEIKKLKNFKWLQESMIIYLLALFILLIFSNKSEFFIYLLFYMPIAFVIFNIFEQKNSLVVVSAVILSLVIVMTFFVIKISTSINNQIVFGTITFITASLFAISYLKQRISHAEIN